MDSQKDLVIIIYGKNQMTKETIDNLVPKVTMRFNSRFISKEPGLGYGQVGIVQIPAMVYNCSYCVTILGSFEFFDSDIAFLKNIIAEALKTEYHDIFFNISACYK